MYKRSGIGIIDYEDGDLRGDIWYILLSLRIGGRGLKRWVHHVNDILIVAPYRRAWIETLCSAYIPHTDHVAPYRRAWIETVISRSDKRGASMSLRIGGRGLKLSPSLMIAIINQSLRIGGRGLKQLAVGSLVKYISRSV